MAARGGEAGDGDNRPLIGGGGGKGGCGGGLGGSGGERKGGCPAGGHTQTTID
jgi:hypothetical protein